MACLCLGARRQHLAELVLQNGYEGDGIKRPASSSNTSRIDDLYQDPRETGQQGQRPQLTLHYGDVTDGTNLIRIFQQPRQYGIYILGAQSRR